MGPSVPAVMPEQPSLWEQADLLEPGRPQPPAPAAPPPAAPSPLASAAIAAAAPAAPCSAPAPVRLPAFPAPAPRDRGRAPERLLILDTETTGLTPADGQCIEVGAVLFHVPSRAVLTQISCLLPCGSNPAEAINGIAAAVTTLEQPWREALACFEAMAAAADALLAHNAAFDRQWFGRGVLPRLERPWICSMEDIRWPAERQLRANPSVRDLALAYGIPVWAAHRALTDCIYLAQVLERCADLDTLLVAAMEPRRLYRALLSYAERHRAREAGFRWNDPVAGAWTRRLSQSEAEALPFLVEALEQDPACGSGPDAAAEPLPRSA